MQLSLRSHLPSLLAMASALMASLPYAVFADTTAAPGTAESLQLLKDGNARYLEGVQKFPKIDPIQRLRTATEGQKPIATVLGCSDARVPVETTFDRKFGDLFVVRVAGNVCHMAERASIEYGVNYLKTPLVVVLGHTKCGAVQAAASGQQLSGSLPLLIEEINPAVSQVKKDHPELKGDEFIDECIKQNVRKSIADLLKESPTIAQAVRQKKVMVVGAIRDLKTGKVTWLD